MNKKTILKWGLLALAASLLFGSLALPLWKMRMEAPQYRDEEALEIIVYPGEMKGDLSELKTLNQYIGVHTPDTLPQLDWLPRAIAGGAIVGLFAAFFARCTHGLALFLAPVLLSGAIGFAALQAKGQMYDLGHNRDEKIIMRGVKDFTPPFLGHARVAQFDISSWLATGSYLVGSAIALQFAAAWLGRKRRETSVRQRPEQKSLLPKREKAFA